MAGLGGTMSVIDAATSTVTATFPVGDGPHSLAMDPAAGTVYAVNAGADTVSVIDAATNTVTTTIPIPHSPAEVAVDPAGRRRLRDQRWR